ncbi:MAG: DUF2934 domain-containing protein [Steroidobacteraceae bacterium]
MDIPSHDKAIRELAYSIWEERGRQEGHDLEYWLEAEIKITGTRLTHTSGEQAAKKLDESAKQSFPASDPPASHLPDVPPSNSSAKWAAYATQGEKQQDKTPTATHEVKETNRKRH